jgi:hypothetical protein
MLHHTPNRYIYKELAMILKELRDEICAGLYRYTRTFNGVAHIPQQRQNDIRAIHNFLELEDPVLICRKVRHRLGKVAVPFFSFLTFIDANHFVNCVYAALNQEKFQEINLLRTIINEKNQVILELQNARIEPASFANQTSENLEYVISQIGLLRRENEFLYQTIVSLDQKITAMEAENKQYLERAVRAEHELMQIKQQPKLAQSKQVSFRCVVQDSMRQDIVAPTCKLVS